MKQSGFFNDLLKLLKLRRKTGVDDIVNSFKVALDKMLQEDSDKAVNEVEMTNGIIIKTTIEIDDSNWDEKELDKQ